jgi:2'-5' RNA ligase
MAYAVVFYFDEISEIPILNVWNELGKVNLSSSLHKETIRPHMTLAIYDSINCSECEGEIKHFSAKSGILNIQVDHFGIFPRQSSVIFIAPPPNNKLMGFQEKIHQILTGNVKGSWEMYQPGNWVPHCTLARDIEKKDFPTAIETCMKMKLPLDLRITRVGVVEFEPIIPLFDIGLTDE